MLRGYRLFILAIGLILAAANKPPENSQSVNSTGQNEAQKSADTIATAIREAAKATPQDEGCQDREDKRDSDLCAQWKAADSAKQASEYAFWTLILGAFSTGLLVWTFRETRETARSELRSYLFVDGSHLVIGTATHNTGKVICRVAIKNSGSTPAHHVRHWSNIRIAPFTEEAEMIAPTPLDGLSQSTVAPGSGITADRITDQKPTRAELAGLRKGQVAVFIFGAIEYVDVFKKPHRTNYRVYFSGSWPPPEGVSLLFCNEGNDAD